MSEITRADVLRDTVFRQVENTPVLDIHTHICGEEFGDLLLRGPIELIRYHYLQAETNRVLNDRSPAEFMALDKSEQARLIWQKLFVERSPISEATRGVVTAWNRLGVPDVRDYAGVLAHFAGMSASEHIDRVFEAANVSGVIMTNDPFDPIEQDVWNRGIAHDPRFRAALRIDSILVRWPATWRQLKEMGYDADPDLTEATYPEVMRFLKNWAMKMNPVYVAASLPSTFIMPDDSFTGRILEKVVLPACRELGLPLAMMIGVRRRIMPELGDAGDGVGKCDLNAISYLCRKYPANKFLLTVLARENQYEAVVLARKFRNLHVFGCWWFNNNPSIIEEITRERIEMLGLSVTPQHSDARVLDQLVYKWAHSRRIIAEVLCEKYEYLIQERWYPTEDEIARDVGMLLGGEFERFVA